jgi:hypothetical protein
MQIEIKISGEASDPALATLLAYLGDFSGIRVSGPRKQVFERADAGQLREAHNFRYNMREQFRDWLLEQGCSAHFTDVEEWLGGKKYKRSSASPLVSFYVRNGWMLATKSGRITLTHAPTNEELRIAGYQKKKPLEEIL